LYTVNRAVWVFPSCQAPIYTLSVSTHMPLTSHRNWATFTHDQLTKYMYGNRDACVCGQVTDMLKMKEKDSNYKKITIIRTALFWVITQLVVVISYCLKQRYLEHMRYIKKNNQQSVLTLHIFY